MKTSTTRGLHPILLAAGIAVILVCVAGIGAIMGWFPDSIGRESESIAQMESKAAAVPEKPVRETVAQKRPPAPVRVASKPAIQKVAICANCGVIESIRVTETSGSGSGIGAVGGAVVGGLLGNQVGGGHGKEAMTVVGAIGGAFAGNHIEKRVNSVTGHEILVRMENGTSQLINESGALAWRNGDHVKVVNGVIRSA